MKSVFGVASATALLLSLGACATVTRGTTTDFKVASTPPGAELKTSTGFACSPTPCSVKLPRKTAFDATVTLAGYKPQTVHIQSKVGGGGTAGFIGNAVAGGAIGMVIDGSDGAMDDLVPNPLNVTLDQDTQPVTAPTPAPPTPASTSGAAPAGTAPTASQ
jgi:hypothetical protein